MHRAQVAILVATLALSGFSAQAITVDGTADAGYGPAITVQTTQTQFGNNGDNTTDLANGSELDAAYGIISGGTLFLVLAGNVESNFNKLDIFIDSQAGGQNQLLGTNPNVDFDGLNRMGDDGSGNGMIFDTGFESDYYLTMGGGNVPYQLFANFAETPTGGGGTGNFIGQGGAVTDGTLTGGTNPDGIRITINNSNVGGVGAGCAASSGSGVTTGVEIAIPLSAIGNPAGCVRVTAFINGGGHDFLSNQVLGGLPATTCNLGEPRNVDFRQHAGEQNFSVCQGTVAVEEKPWSDIKLLYR